MQDEPLAVESLSRSWPGSTEVKFGKDIVFDEGDVILREQTDQLMLAVVRHATAKWVVKGRIEDAGFDVIPVERRSKGAEINALPRMSRDLDRFKPQALNSH